jgi:ABC-type transport system involved in multi-copper enzyme maturation permease subunit
MFAVVIGATLFVREKEGRKLELLLVTPITPMEIVRTKLTAGLFAPEGVVVIVMWFVCALLWGVKLGPIECPVHMVASALFLAFAYVLAGALSLRSRTLYTAALSSAGILLLVTVVLPFTASTVSEGTTWSTVVRGALALVHPTHTTRAVGDGTWPLAAGYAAIYVGGIILLLAGMVKHLDRYPERP